MDAVPAYFCLIQYCPDPARYEAVNVGILLFCPSRSDFFLQSRVAPSNERVRRMFGKKSYSSEFVDRAKRAMVERIEAERRHIRTVEDLKAFAATRANEIRLSPPRLLATTDPKAELDRMFDEYVLDRRERPSTRRSSPRTIPALRKALTPLVRDLKVRTQYPHVIPIDGRTEVFPFAWGNGRLNLVAEQVFPREPDHAKARAKELVTDSQLLDSPPEGPGAVLQVVASIPPEVADAKTAIVAMFKQFHARLILETDIPNFVHEVEGQAHALPLP
ncbi:MAG: DUF3037 domain-containing protein [Planctomycetes bacterium]|nr:DUF3037 domain-containing protein [Planctomycetota bacterium]